MSTPEMPDWPPAITAASSQPAAPQLLSREALADFRDSLHEPSASYVGSSADIDAWLAQLDAAIDAGEIDGRPSWEIDANREAERVASLVLARLAPASPPPAVDTDTPATRSAPPVARHRRRRRAATPFPPEQVPALLAELDRRAALPMSPIVFPDLPPPLTVRAVAELVLAELRPVQAVASAPESAPAPAATAPPATPLVRAPDAGITRREWRAAIHRGDLQAKKIGREYAATREDYDAYLAARQVAAKPARQRAKRVDPATAAVDRALASGKLRVVRGGRHR